MSALYHLVFFEWYGVACSVHCMSYYLCHF